MSVIVPARDEERSIVECVGSIASSRYPSFEIIVVDDRSSDRTRALAEAVPVANARKIEVVAGAELPAGWLGKPWACHQGATRAEGQLLLFTDADTTHAPGLMASAVGGMREDGAQAITLIGRQLAESFWERVVQPQIFAMMVFRYRALDRPFEQSEWRSAIANGQYILIERDEYDAIAGHEGVKGHVVEDLALAQRVVNRGSRLTLRLAEDSFATRMYRSLGEIVAGWSKNVVIGGKMTLPRWLGPFMPAGVILTIVGLWLLPPVSAAVSLAGAGPDTLASWATLTMGLSASFWIAVHARFGVPFLYGLLYPLGASIAAFIVARSWVRGGRVSWKGRTYRS